MEYFVISAKFVPLKYYTLSSQLQRLASFSVGCSGRRILSPGQINIMRKWCIPQYMAILINRDVELTPKEIIHIAQEKANWRRIVDCSTADK